MTGWTVWQLAEVDFGRLGLVPDPDIVTVWALY